MKIVAFRIPKQIVLPGLIVQIRVVSNKDADGDCGWWEYDEDGKATVYINAKLSLPVQRYTLLHELQHVMTDYLDQAIERYPKVFQTKHMARKAKQ